MVEELEIHCLFREDVNAYHEANKTLEKETKQISKNLEERPSAQQINLYNIYHINDSTISLSGIHKGADDSQFTFSLGYQYANLTVTAETKEKIEETISKLERILGKSLKGLN